MTTARNITHDEFRTILTAISPEARQAFIYGLRTAAKHMKDEMKESKEEDKDMQKELELLEHAFKVAADVEDEIAELNREPATSEKK